MLGEVAVEVVVDEVVVHQHILLVWKDALQAGLKLRMPGSRA